jgi:hypothetical protein
MYNKMAGTELESDNINNMDRDDKDSVDLEAELNMGVIDHNQSQTPNQSFHTLSKGYDHTVGESTGIVNKDIQPHTMYSLYDSDILSITMIIQLDNKGLMWK